ncbi:TonB-dependent receptor plug domain-containing protein [Pseudomonas purpurea]|uniref:TonB-dependent siderophore receptor n=1 Tax=Pseudomonas purpurea TaxID=3136737 RepID=UPI003262D633
MGTRVPHRDSHGLPHDCPSPRPTLRRHPLATLVHGLALGVSLGHVGHLMAAEQSADDTRALVLENSVVTGVQESPTGKASGYVAKRSLSGTKTDTALNEIPQSISVITRDQMDAQQVQSVSEALRYTAGVQANTTAANQRFDNISIRGFDVTSTGMLRDGLRGTTTQAWPKIEAYGLERVDVLKGPSSVLFGQNAPGGVVNQISKRPLDQPYHEVQIQGGSFDRAQAQFDVSGPLDDEGQFLYRLVGPGSRQWHPIRPYRGQQTVHRALLHLAAER